MGGSALGVSMKIDRSNRQNQIFHLFRMQCSITGGENSTLTDPKQRNLVVAGFLTYAIDGGVDVVIHIIIDREPTFGSARLAPVDQPKIEPL